MREILMRQAAECDQSQFKGFTPCRQQAGQQGGGLSSASTHERAQPKAGRRICRSVELRRDEFKEAQLKTFDCTGTNSSTRQTTKAGRQGRSADWGRRESKAGGLRVRIT